MDDIVPGLLEQIQNEFRTLYRGNHKARLMWTRLAQGHGRYDDANGLAVEIGEMLSQALNKYITADSLPEGKMWYNIALRILEPTLRTNYDLMTEICSMAQENANKAAGIGLGTVTPEFNDERMLGLVDKVSNSENFDDVSWLIDEPIVNFTQAIVDDSIRDNAKFQASAGLNPRIRRTLDSSQTRTTMRGKKRVKYLVPCSWCQNLAGEYDYITMPKSIRDNIFRRHENCRCTVEYIDGGKFTNVHSKAESYVDGTETEASKQARIEREQKEKEAQANREEEERAVRILMEQHPTWSWGSAVKYYRMNKKKLNL